MSLTIIIEIMTLQQKLYNQRQMANAIQCGHEFHTMTIGDMSYSVMLPTPQTCGTMTQQRTYAMDKAMEILEFIQS